MAAKQTAAGYVHPEDFDGFFIDLVTPYCMLKDTFSN
jgi:hypothetical protein